MMAFPSRATLALAAALLTVAAADAGFCRAAGAERFVDGLGDVPAMPGLTAVAGEPLVFDKPAGRIVEALLRGGVTRKAVIAFYAGTMPQLGWRLVGSTRFEREGEELRLEFPGGAGGETTVRFVLKPR